MTEINIVTESPEAASIIVEILMEVERAEKKHPVWPNDQLYAASIVAEENGELTRAAVQYEMEGGDIEEIRKEAIQTAATCIRLLKNLKNDDPGIMEYFEKEVPNA